ncbi:MAG TPA: hypothetical protein VHT02_03840 [Methylocella sp.]|jgi:hypothetical protein|nr:hypothetical protein [Methylocella sp.]
MNKASIREFRLASTGEEGLHPYLNERGAFLFGGTSLLARDGHGDFAPLPRRDLEIVVSAGFGLAVDLGARMGSLATLAKALNEGDYALAAIALRKRGFRPCRTKAPARGCKRPRRCFDAAPPRRRC